MIARSSPFTNDSSDEDYIETTDLVVVQQFASIIISMFLCAYIISRTPDGLKSLIICSYGSLKDDEYQDVNV